MMPYKTILIHAGCERRFQNQLAIGVDLATRFQAHIVGLSVMPAAITVPAGVPGASDFATIDQHRVNFRKEAQRMKAMFERSIAGSPISAEWIAADAERAGIESVLIDHAHSSDLILAGPIDAGAAGGRNNNLTERLILGSGRPVLVAPRTNGYTSPLGGRVLVAWNGSKEATRAAFDALPILKQAQYVKVLSIGDSKDNRGQQARSPEQLCKIFARHRVQASPEVIALPGADVGAALVSAIKAEGADLLVMGCYGHPRLYEYALGGATRFVLHETPIPVLMSH